MAEHSEDGVEAIDDSGSKGFSAKKVLIIVVPLLLLGGGGAGAYFTGMLDGLLGKAPTEEGAAAEGEGHGGEASAEGEGHGGEGAAFLKMPDMMVNLNSGDTQQRYIRLAIQLELESEEDLKKVEAVLPRVQDRFQTYLRELRVKDLRGSGGLYRLRMELLSRVNEAAAPVKVKDVLFQEILIQ